MRKKPIWKTKEFKQEMRSQGARLLEYFDNYIDQENRIKVARLKLGFGELLHEFTPFYFRFDDFLKATYERHSTMAAQIDGLQSLVREHEAVMANAAERLEAAREESQSAELELESLKTELKTASEQVQSLSKKVDSSEKKLHFCIEFTWEYVFLYASYAKALVQEIRLLNEALGHQVKWPATPVPERLWTQGHRTFKMTTFDYFGFNDVDGFDDVVDKLAVEEHLKELPKPKPRLLDDGDFDRTEYYNALPL